MENIYTLDAVEFTSTSIEGYTSTTTINFYSLLTVMLGIIIVAILMGFSIFGFGLNDSSTILMRKYLSLLMLITLLFICSDYYILQFGLFGTILNVFFLAIYVFKIIDMLGESKE